MDQSRQILGPILTAHLFPKLDGLLVELLRSLAPDEWTAQTIAPKWQVKDVAAHLLDTQLRKLSIVRDRHALAAPAPADLVPFINRLNAEGVAFYGRLSQSVLTSLIEVASRESAAFHQALDPFADAVFAVSWAGEETSLNWLDTARELTERWHHQQQIRLAVNRPGIMTPELYRPVLDCFLRALPFTYRSVSAEPGTLVEFHLKGDCGGTWCLHHGDEAWRLINHPTGNLKAQVTIPQELAWRIFTKGIDRAAATAQTQVTGDRTLGLHILTATAVVG
jgi:uncharacterized protein (TIGR03083 family)